jgi:hypothetical protein
MPISHNAGIDLALAVQFQHAFLNAPLNLKKEHTHFLIHLSMTFIVVKLFKLNVSCTFLVVPAKKYIKET